jgi:hypothetical protein
MLQHRKHRIKRPARDIFRSAPVLQEKDAGMTKKLRSTLSGARPFSAVSPVKKKTTKPFPLSGHITGKRIKGRILLWKTF